MDELLKTLLTTPGVSGCEGEIAAVMRREMSLRGAEVRADAFGNLIGRVGSGPVKVMVAAHMDEIGLMVKYVSEKGYLSFIKLGGIDDRLLPGHRVIIQTRSGPVQGLIGQKPVHLQKDDERKNPVRYEDMFIDIGCASREDALARVQIGDPVVFEPNAGVLNGDLIYGRAADNRAGCYALLKLLESAPFPAEIFAVATTQEELGLKGARTSAFGIMPDYALVIDTTIAGDTPQIKETESSLKLGAGPAVTIIEASGRGTVVSPAMREIILACARERAIPYQMDVIEGGMTDGAVISMSREGVPCGVISIPTRYLHGPSGVFHLGDLRGAVDLTRAVIEQLAARS